MPPRAKLRSTTTLRMTQADEVRWARAARLAKQTRAMFIRDAINDRADQVLGRYEKEERRHEA